MATLTLGKRTLFLVPLVAALAVGVSAAHGDDRLQPCRAENGSSDPWLVLSLQRHQKGLYRVRLDGTGIGRLTSGLDGSPAYWAAGKKLFFLRRESLRQGAAFADLYSSSVRFAGAGQPTLVPNSVRRVMADVSAFSISGRGNLLAAVTTDGVVILDLRSGRRHLWARGEEVLNIGWKPDGLQLAVMRSGLLEIRDPATWVVIAKRKERWLDGELTWSERFGIITPLFKLLSTTIGTELVRYSGDLTRRWILSSDPSSQAEPQDYYEPTWSPNGVCLFVVTAPRSLNGTGRGAILISGTSKPVPITPTWLSVSDGTWIDKGP